VKIFFEVVAERGLFTRCLLNGLHNFVTNFTVVGSVRLSG